jgi:N-acetylmuramoyl-L-alanine amidase
VQENIQQNNTRQTKEAGSNIFVLDRITSPAVLVECGFLSNPSECSKLSDPKYCQELSLAISLAILKYIHSPT